MYSLQLKNVCCTLSAYTAYAEFTKRHNTPLHKEHLTDSVKVKLPLVGVFTYGYALKVS